MNRANGMRWDAENDQAHDTQKVLGERQVGADNYSSAWWLVQKDTGGTWTLRNRQDSSLCAQPEKVTADALVRLRTCNNSSIQQWALTDDPATTWTDSRGVTHGAGVLIRPADNPDFAVTVANMSDNEWGGLRLRLVRDSDGQIFGQIRKGEFG